MSESIEKLPEPIVEIKPKRKYVRKPKPVGDGFTPAKATEIVPEVVQPVVREPEPIAPEPEPVPEVASTKKPRTEKQIQAFNKMREARLKKQSELEHLKEVAKQQVLLEKEQIKLEKVEDKILKVKATRKPRAKKPKEDAYVSEPEPIIQVSTLKPILFV